MPELWFILAAVAVLVALVVVWGVTRERKRDAEMALAGERLGLVYERDGRALESEPFTRFSLFQEGRRKRFKNVLTGRVGGTADDESGGNEAIPKGIDVLLFDYRYVTGTHRHHQNHQATVAAFHVVGESLPELSLQPEGLLHKIGGLLGYQDIDFEEKPGFSWRYLLRGPQEDAIRRLFTPEVLEFFENRPGWCLEAGGDWIIVFKRGSRVQAVELAEFLKESFELCTMLAIHF